jgi:hypothetical protein
MMFRIEKAAKAMKPSATSSGASWRGRGVRHQSQPEKAAQIPR